MNGITDATSPVSKRSTSPRPPAVGEEVKKFHDTSQHPSELYKNWNMDCQSKELYGDSANCSGTPTCRENATESSEYVDASSNPSPPAPYKWAQSLQCLLEDIQGVKLFEKFLKQEGHDAKCLSFLFACRGIKKNDPNDQVGLVKLIKVVFEKNVRRISAISDATKEEIRQKLTSKTDIDNTIFDTAQREVETYMMKTTYPNFLRSDLYIQYLGGLQNELLPEKEPVVLSESSDLLPTVHENSELTVTSNKIPMTKGTLMSRNKVSSVSKFKSEGQAGFLRSPYSYSSYHVRYASYLPTSAQDSELQSLSSDAQTDDTMSLTDGSNVEFPVYSQSKQKRSQKASKHMPFINKERHLPESDFIPVTKRLPEGHLNPKKPEDFIGELIRKLNKVAEDRNAEQKMMERLKSIESADGSRSDGSYLNSRQLHKSNTNPVFDSGFFCAPPEENCQEILDQHISRVFDSGQQTPASPTSPPVARPSDVFDKSRTPFRNSGYCKLPDVPLGASHKRNQVSQYTVPNSIKCRRDHDIHSTDRAMNDYVSDDNVPVDYSKRPKEHSRRYTSKKFPSIDSGISLGEPGGSNYSKVTHWLEAKRISELEREQYLWRNSSTSPVLGRSSSNRKTISCNSYRSGCQDVGCSQWLPTPSHLPQDCTTGYPAVDTTLVEARKKLEDENRAKMKLKKPNRKSCSINVVEQATVNTSSNDVTTVGYSYGRHSVPYLSKLPGKNITLRHFKTLLSKKGNFRYFFKRASDQFGTGVVFEEVTDDFEVLPLWEGKVFCVIESMDDNS